VAGVPEKHTDPIRAICDAALEIREASNRISESIGADGWKIRIGMHVGPLIAGVIGRHKFSYDVWGATVNLASRMESGSEPGGINVSRELYERARPWYRWQPRGLQPVKRLDDQEMFFLLGRNESAIREDMMSEVAAVS
jgi:class 3 adenylate cyclase